MQILQYRMEYTFARIVIYIVLLKVHNAWMIAPDVPSSEDLQQWCPYTKFCDLEPRHRLSPELVSDGRPMFCCESCSCTNNCGLHRNCCREELDRYKIDDTLNTICKPLVTKEGKAGMNEHYFHIVDKCPDISESCNDRHVAPWGSYHPVYSRTTRMIYYNKWCAKCHNQTNTRTFETILQILSQVEPYSPFILDTHVGHSNGLDSFLRFIPPGEATIYAQLCYPSIIRHCNPNSKRLEHLTKLCQSFNATYHDGTRAYGNVYCYICSFYDLPSEEIFEDVKRKSLCHSTFKEVYQLRRNSPLTVILNSKTTQGVDESDEDVDDELVWCEGDMSRNKGKCRKKYCPEGQIHFHGDCNYIGDTFFVRSLSVVIVLAPMDKVSVVELTAFNNDGKNDSTRHALLKPKWFSTWGLQLLYKANDSDGYVEHFVANFYIKSALSFNPKGLFGNIKKALGEPWSITVLGNRHELRAELDRNLEYVPYDDDGQYIPLWLYFHIKYSNFDIGPYTSHVLQEILPIEGRQQIGHLVISRMFFCDQVELLPQEYIIENGNIFLKRRAMHMGHGSFVKVYVGNTTTYRVCLSDLFDESSSGVWYKTSYFWFMIGSVMLRFCL